MRALRVDDTTGGLAGIADEIDGWHFRRHLLNRHPGEFNTTTFKCEKVWPDGLEGEIMSECPVGYSNFVVGGLILVMVVFTTLGRRLAALLPLHN